MTFYSILAVSPTNSDWVADYIGPANQLVAQHGGKYLARTASHEQLEGNEKGASLRILIEWPSRQAALRGADRPDLCRPVAGRQRRSGLTALHSTAGWVPPPARPIAFETAPCPCPPKRPALNP